MTKQEIMQAVEQNIVGNQYQLFGYTDIDNAMVALGATSVFNGIDIQDFVDDEFPCWSFQDDEDEIVNIGLRYKFISGEDELKNLIANENAEDWEVRETAEKTTIEILSAEEI